MTKKKYKQTRRAISISGATYLRLKAYAQEHGVSMSGIVENETKSFLDLFWGETGEICGIKKEESAGLKEDRLALITKIANRQAP